MSFKALAAAAAMDRAQLMSRSEGRVIGFRSGCLRARLPITQVGNIWVTEAGEPFEVVGFEEETSTLLALGGTNSLSPGASLRRVEHGSKAPRLEDVIGRAVDGNGHCLTTGIRFSESSFGIYVDAPKPTERVGGHERWVTGIRAIDGVHPLVVGQRIGVFAGSGVGKTTLMHSIARSSRADIIVFALIGERGREVQEAIAALLHGELGSRLCIVAATSDRPPAERARAAHLATALAEQGRACGANVLLMMDSVTRYARALREAKLLVGERPVRRGYPASVFAELPALLERPGKTRSGSISALYTVLVEGGDMEEPIADEVRGILDGHLVLSRSLVSRGILPAIDPRQSLSRLHPRGTPLESRLSAALKEDWRLLEDSREAVELGLYEPGTSPQLESALGRRDRLLEFLKQSPSAVSDWTATAELLRQLYEGVEGGQCE